MWHDFKPRQVSWNLKVSNPDPDGHRSVREQLDHEVRLLNLLLPTWLESPPCEVTKRQRSPDFEVALSGEAKVFVEHVDAVPNDGDGLNLAKRRSTSNTDPYHIDARQFGGVIGDRIADKCRKAKKWIRVEPQLEEQLVLIVNGGKAPLWLRWYFCDADAMGRAVPVTSAAPFQTVIVGDETGAFVWTELKTSATQSRHGKRG